MGLYKKGKTCIKAKFHWADLLTCICSHSREKKSLPYSLINMIAVFCDRVQTGETTHDVEFLAINLVFIEKEKNYNRCINYLRRNYRGLQKSHFTLVGISDSCSLTI